MNPNMKPILTFVLGGVLATGVVLLVTGKKNDVPVPTPVPTITAPAPEAATPPAAAVTTPAPVVETKPSPVPATHPTAHKSERHQQAKANSSTTPTTSAGSSTTSQPTASASNQPPAPYSPPMPAYNENRPPVKVEPPPPPKPNVVTIKSGTVLNVRVNQTLSTDRNFPGDAFNAVLDQPLVVDGFVVAEKGARVEGRIVEADKGGRVQGRASLAVELTRLSTADGQRVAIHTENFSRVADSAVKKDAAKVGAVAGIGAIIGAIAGGGKGAAIGAVAGGAAGTGGVMATRGSAAAIASETRIPFRLRESVTVTERLRGGYQD